MWCSSILSIASSSACCRVSSARASGRPSAASPRSSAPARQPRVVLLGRLSLFGPAARRLHEEIIPVTAAWRDTRREDSPLTPFAEAGEATTIGQLDERLAQRRLAGRRRPGASGARPWSATSPICVRISKRVPRVSEQGAIADLAENGRREAEAMAALLQRQIDKVREAMRSKQPPEAPEQMEFFGPTRGGDPQAARTRNAPVRGRPALLGRQAAAAPARAGKRTREGPPRLRGAGAPAGACRPRLSLARDELSTDHDLSCASGRNGGMAELSPARRAGRGRQRAARDGAVTPIRQTPLDTEAAALALRLDPGGAARAGSAARTSRRLDVLRAGARLAGEARRRQPRRTGGRSCAQRHGPGARDAARARPGAVVERRGARGHPGAGPRHAASDASTPTAATSLPPANGRQVRTSGWSGCCAKPMSASAFSSRATRCGSSTRRAARRQAGSPGRSRLSAGPRAGRCWRVSSSASAATRSSPARRRRGCARCWRPRARRRTPSPRSSPARCLARSTSCCAACTAPRPQQIEAIAERDPHHLYEGLLTCLMRLVFLLYAEDRDLLPSSTDPHLKQLWESGYSIKTLYARLLVDEALNPDTMDERRGGWGQLLAVFRLIHRGHRDWVTGRGGKLFDPDGFPVPGRPREGQRARGRKSAARLGRNDPAHPARADDHRGPQPLRREDPRAAVLSLARRRIDRLGLRDRDGLHHPARDGAHDRAARREEAAELHRPRHAPGAEAERPAEMAEGPRHQALRQTGQGREGGERHCRA